MSNTTPTPTHRTCSTTSLADWSIKGRRLLYPGFEGAVDDVLAVVDVGADNLFGMDFVRMLARCRRRLAA